MNIMNKIMAILACCLGTTLVTDIAYSMEPKKRQREETLEQQEDTARDRLQDFSLQRLQELHEQMRDQLNTARDNA